MKPTMLPSSSTLQYNRVFGVGRVNQSHAPVLADHVLQEATGGSYHITVSSRPGLRVVGRLGQAWGGGAAGWWVVGG